MKRAIIVLVVFALLGFVATASAQSVKNPSTLQFTASVDHAQLTKYVAGFFAPGALDPVQEVDLGLPTPDGTNTVTIKVNTQPLSFNVNYVVKVKSVADAASSDWSEPSNPFDRIPGPPSKPVVK